MKQPGAGISLIELLVCLGIVTFLLLRMTTPGLHEWRLRKEADAVAQELIGMVALARAHAIAGNIMVTLCRSSDGKHCEGGWGDGSIIFTDRDEDRVIDADDILLYRMAPLDTSGSLSFNSFQNRQYLQMTPRGFTRHQNGNFTFCPGNGDLRLARQVIISLSGRSRMASDKDGDGVVEDSQGRALECK